MPYIYMSYIYVCIICFSKEKSMDGSILSALKLAQSLGFLSELSIYICMWLFIVQQAMN